MSMMRCANGCLSFIVGEAMTIYDQRNLNDRPANTYSFIHSESIITLLLLIDTIEDHSSYSLFL